MKAINLIIISAMLLYSCQKNISVRTRDAASVSNVSNMEATGLNDNISLLGQRFYPLWQWLDGWRRRIFVKATRRRVVVALGR